MRALRLSFAAVLAFAIGVVALGFPPGAALAASGYGTLFSETFQNASANAGIYYSNSSTTSNPPCLTAASPIPTASPGATSGYGLHGCPVGDPPSYSATALPDPAGEGALRLTDNTNNQSGYVLYNSALPSSGGMQLNFNYWSYNGSGADGITVFFVDGAQAPSVAGAFGGSLGYAQKNTPSTIAGLAGGYVGIGLDEYGNFEADTEGRYGGEGTGPYPNSVGIRGAVDAGGTTDPDSYPFIAASGYGGIPAMSTYGTINASSTTTRSGTPNAKRAVRVTLSPANVVTVQVDFTGTGTSYQTVVPPQQITGQTLPSTLKVGYAGSTGGSTDIHELSNLTVDPAPADVALTMTQSPANLASGGGRGQSLSYTLYPTVSDVGGSLPVGSTVTVTDNFATSGTLENPAVTASQAPWTCGIASSVMTCTMTVTANQYNATSSGYSSGATLPTITATAQNYAKTGTVTNTASITATDSAVLNGTTGNEDLYAGNDSATTTGGFVTASSPVIVLYKRITAIIHAAAPTVVITPAPYPSDSPLPFPSSSPSGIATPPPVGATVYTGLESGDLITYTIFFANTGGSTATGSGSNAGPSFTDTLTGSVIYQPGTMQFACCYIAGGGTTAKNVTGTTMSYDPTSLQASWVMPTPLPISTTAPSGQKYIQGWFQVQVKVP